MKDGGGVNYYGFSARHVRIKYQAVAASIGFCMIAILTVESVSIPGFVKFSSPPALWMLELATAVFAVFSIVSFYSQTSMERKIIPKTSLLFKHAVKRQREQLIPKIEDLGGDKLDAFEAAIMQDLQSVWKEEDIDAEYMMKWQDVLNRFFEVSGDVNFEISQLESFEKEIRKEIYQGNHGYDSHYRTSLITLGKILDEMVELFQDPKEGIRLKGGYHYTALIETNIKRIRSLAIALPKQCKSLLEDLTQQVKIRDFNQEFLSVAVPTGVSIAFTAYGSITILQKYMKTLLCQA